MSYIHTRVRVTLMQHNLYITSATDYTSYVSSSSIGVFSSGRRKPCSSTLSLWRKRTKPSYLWEPNPNRIVYVFVFPWVAVLHAVCILWRFSAFGVCFILVTCICNWHMYKDISVFAIDCVLILTIKCWFVINFIDFFKRYIAFNKTIRVEESHAKAL